MDISTQIIPEQENSVIKVSEENFIYDIQYLIESRLKEHFVKSDQYQVLSKSLNVYA